jgi:predicted lysophospholipase L1 biosynthesis ABC-type transport system permease subunit
MKEEQDYIKDIAEIRSMMERSSKFLSLSGWAGILAGLYALAGTYVAYAILNYNPSAATNVVTGNLSTEMSNVIFLAIIILILAVGTAIFLSAKKADKSGEKFWNATTKRLATAMAVPLIAGGLFILVMISRGMIGFIAPLSLLFYGLALYNISKFTYVEVKSLGLLEIALGLISSYFIEYGLICWSIGFGVLHIIYGIYMHYKYEK